MFESTFRRKPFENELEKLLGYIKDGFEDYHSVVNFINNQVNIIHTTIEENIMEKCKDYAEKESDLREWALNTYFWDRDLIQKQNVCKYYKDYTIARILPAILSIL